jgi:hypothetical protein
VKAAAQPVLRKGRVAGETVFFADVDADGHFDALGVDAWFVGGMRSLLPLEKSAVLKRSKIYWRVESDGSLVRFRAEWMEGSREQLEALRQLNGWRLANGLPPVSLGSTLSDACLKHCKYMERYGMTHTEREGRQSYSPEGAKAGRHSCIGVVDPETSVLRFYASFYHRVPLMHPDTRVVGIAATRHFSCVDGISGRTPRAWRWPVIVPAPDSAGHPTRFGAEHPRPYPDGLQPGFPITLTFPKGKIADARATLRLRSAEGRELEVVVSSPEKPANMDRPHTRKSICVIPCEALAPRTTYWIQVAWSEEGEPRGTEWRFTTGNRHPVTRLR